MRGAHMFIGRGAGTAVQPLLARALLAGFLASTAMVVAFAVAFVLVLIVGQTHLGVLTEWLHGLTSNTLINVARPNLYAATGAFFLGGLLWALLYAGFAEPRLRGPGWQRGIAFALVPWAFSLLVFLPLVGGGMLGIALGAGPLPIIGNLILHVVYGGVLGAACAQDARARLSEDVSSQIGAARGLLIGLGVGVALGALAALAPDLTGAGALRMNPLGVLLALALVGTAFGALVGSLSTES